LGISFQLSEDTSAVRRFPLAKLLQHTTPWATARVVRSSRPTKITARSNGAAREAGQFISGRRQATLQHMVMYE
jgi:hypothetical protein